MENNDASGAKAQEDSNQAEQIVDDVVSKKAYEEVARDMHKYKQQMRELKASVNEYQTRLQLQEEEKLKEKEQWKDLFEKRTQELDIERQNAQNLKSQFLDAAKLSELKRELGGVLKDEYLRFANLNGIEVREDGSIDLESVREVANNFRAEHGQLISPKQTANITGHHTEGFERQAPKDVSQMSKAELLEMYAKMKSN